MYPTLRASSFFIILVVIIPFIGCSEDENISLYHPTTTTFPNPTISSVTPIGSAVAGVDTVVIQGTGFSSILTDNEVFFNAQSAVVIQATGTEIKIIAPLLVSDSVTIRVAVHGSYEFSNKVGYSLKPAVAIFGDLQSIELSKTVTTDSSGNLYTGFSVNSLEAGILKFDPLGTRSAYAPKTGGDWTDIKMGPGGYLYAVRNIRAVYRFAPGGGAAATVWSALTSGVTLGDIDFDQNGNLWAGGNNISIYRIAPDKTVTTYPFTGEIHSLRVYDGYLYFAALTDAGEKIWRAQITSGGLGTPEIYFDFATAFPQVTPLAITFTSDGDLYIGVDSEAGIVVVTPGKSYRTRLSVYKQLFGSGVAVLSWGNIDDLYCSTVDGLLLKINVTGEKSAPYYGATL